MKIVKALVGESRLPGILFGVLLVTALHAQPDTRKTTFALVNSPQDELSPVLSPDGKMLFFTRANHPGNSEGVRDPGDIWVSVKTDSTWSAPVNAGEVVNNRAYNAVVGFSADGSQLFLMGHYQNNGAPAKSQGISVSRKSQGGWTSPENIYIPYFLNKSSLAGGFISDDGNVLVFSAETYGTLGVEDIYVSLRKPDGTWAEPRNAGPGINTSRQELSPSLSKNGSSLFFSSNGRGGEGSFDVFMSHRLDNTYTQWSAPVPVPGLNTSGRELFYREAGESALYTSTTNSDGYGDIKQLNPDQVPEDTAQVTSIVFTPRIPETPGMLVLSGKVYNADNGKPISGAIKITGDTLVIITSAEAGYSIQLGASGTYLLEVTAAGFINAFEKLELSTQEVRSLTKDFALQPVAVGTTVTLKNILFIQGQPELLPESYAELNVVVDFMKANPHLEIELSGHTDNRGTYRSLLTLSQKRVNRVKQYLVGKGIDSRRITGKGYGGTKPIASNDTEEFRQLNRRVEFTIKKV